MLRLLRQFLVFDEHEWQQAGMQCSVAVVCNCTEGMLGFVMGLVGLYSKLLSHRFVGFFYVWHS